MARSERQKLKLLYLQDLLREKSDEAHPIGTQQMIEYLAAKGICAERKSIYDDLHALEDYGLVLHRKGGPKGGYYVARRDFLLPEIKLLIDAVLSCKFLSPHESMTLIRKLAALSSAHEAELLRREIVVAGRLKSEGGDSYRNIDLLHDAIAANRQIEFRYFDWGVDREKHFRNGTYRASPYALCWSEENYYLIAHTERHGITHYRVDKMEEIRLTNLTRHFDRSTDFDPARYGKEVFGMYRGQSQRVKLRFENALAGVVIDRFGRDTLLIPDGDHFTVTVDVSVSPNFLGWVAGFGGRAAIVFPQSAVEEYRSFCKKALAALP